MNSRAQNGSDKTKLSLVEELALFALTRYVHILQLYPWVTALFHLPLSRPQQVI